jgi:hypothetical protein
MSASIPIAMTLAPAHRSAESVAQVQRLAAELGLEPTGTGRASLSFRVSPDQFRKLFGTAAAAVPERPRGAADAGTPAGYEAADLPVPQALRQYVESVSVVPPATRMGKSAGP